MREEEEAHASQAAAKQISAGGAVVGVSSKSGCFFLSLSLIKGETKKVTGGFGSAEKMFLTLLPAGFGES